MSRLNIHNDRLGQKGFSIIEALVYLALFGVFIGGAAAAAFNVFEAASRSQTKAEVQVEGDFLRAKIFWALSGAQSVSVDPSGKSLSVVKWNFTGNPLVILESGGNLQISRGGALAVNLNPAGITVSNVLFIRAQGAGQNPESITAKFTLSARAPNGFLLSQDFSLVKYLRK